MMLTRMTGASCATGVVIFLLAFVLVPVSGADDFDLLIDKALDLSGLAAQLEMLPAVILNAVPDEAFPAGTKRNQSKERSRTLSDGGNVQGTLHQAIRRHCDSEAIEKVVAFYGSNLGRKVARLQKSALSESALHGIREGWKIVASLNPERLALIERLVRANRVGPRNARLLQAAIQGLAEGASPSEAPQVTAKKVEEVGKAIHSLEGSTQHTALVAYAQTFRTLRDEELEKLAAFQESEAAVEFGEAVHEGMEEAVKRIAQEVGENRRRQEPDPGR